VIAPASTDDTLGGVLMRAPLSQAKRSRLKRRSEVNERMSFESFKSQDSPRALELEAVSNIRPELRARRRSAAGRATPRGRRVRRDVAKAVELLGRGRQVDALQILANVLKGHPACCDARHMFAIACLNQGRFEFAERQLALVLDAEPDNAEAHCNLGHTLSGLGRYGDALASFRRAVELEPEGMHAYGGRGCALIELGCHDEALADLDIALAHNPGDRQALLYRDVAMMQLSKRA
jgi:Flp pilus assembly protein TadD